MSRCHWHLDLLLFSPFQSYMICLLRCECVTRVNVSAWGKTQIEYSSKWKNPNTALDGLCSNVSILSTRVYALRGFGSSLRQTALHHVLTREMTYWVTLVCLRNVQLLTDRICVYSVSEHLCYLYIVSLHSYGLWIQWWVCLLVWLSTCFSLFVLRGWIL